MDETHSPDHDSKEARKLYVTKPQDYFGGVRHSFVDPLPNAADARLLEIGCGEGNTAAYARATGKCKWAAGIELCEGPAAEARKSLDLVVVGDVEQMDLPFAEASLDVILMSEVLEHLRDPHRLLVRLLPFLKPGGQVIAGSPNVAHFSVVGMLLQGEWRYAPQGIMDATHLRWFTPKSYQRLFEEAGFEVKEVGPANPLRWQARLLDLLTARRITHLLHQQIVIRAIRPSAA